MINNRQQSGRRRGRGGQRQNNNGSGGGRGPESGNRIDNRARGNAAQLLEKYKTLARDAQQSSDRVLTEYYLQFADHYFRVLSESRARYEENNPSRPRQDYADGEQSFENEDGDESGEDDDDFGFRAPQRAQQPRDQQPRDQQREQQRPRDDRPRTDQPRMNQARDDRPRRDYNEDRGNRDERPRTDQPREDRPRRDQRIEPLSPPDGQAAAFEPRDGTENDTRPARRAPRPQAGGNSRANGHARDDGADEARLDVAVLPPAISAAMPVEPMAADAPPAPRKRGRPRKDATIAPADS